MVGRALCSQPRLGEIEADAPDQFPAMEEQAGGIRRRSEQLHGGRMPQVEQTGDRSRREIAAGRGRPGTEWCR